MLKSFTLFLVGENMKTNKVNKKLDVTFDELSISAAFRLLYGDVPMIKTKELQMLVPDSNCIKEQDHCTKNAFNPETGEHAWILGAQLVVPLPNAEFRY